MTQLQQDAQDLLGLSLTDEQAAQFESLAALLSTWNAQVNLTAITEPDEVRVRHFLDSLSVVKAFDLTETPRRVIDVGTGAGFPGLPLALVFPNLDMTLMDSTAKKLKFPEAVAAQLGLNNIRTLWMRAEEAGRDADHRETYDLVLARSVARLPALVEYALPLAKVGGYVVSMKGATAHEEVNDAARAIRAFGGELDDVVTFPLPGGERTHYLIVIHKVSRTPGEFPRAVGIPTREPLL